MRFITHFSIILYLKFNILSAITARLFTTIKKSLSNSAQERLFIVFKAKQSGSSLTLQRF